MLLIALHKNEDYLNKVESILKDNGIERISRVKRDSLKVSLGEGKYISKISTVSPKADFDKALIASIRKQKLLNLHKALEKMESLDEIQAEKGFICTFPYEQIVEMVLETLERRQSNMIISNHLNVKLICSEIKATDSIGAITELANFLKDSSAINDFSQFSKDVFDREALKSTAIGYGVAMPHARTNAVNKYVVVFGRSHSGIDFKAIDNKPVNLVFLMGIPKEEIGNYLKVLGYLTRLLKKENFRKQLLEAKDSEAMIGIFKKNEK